MKFQVEIPDVVFWKVAGMAEQHDMTVPNYLAELAFAASKARSPLVNDPIIMRWRAGLSDREIAAELNITNSQVSTRRRLYGFPANRSRRSIAA